MNCSLTHLFAKCSCFGSVLCAYCLQLTLVCFAIAIGAFVAWKPRKVIDLQIAAYRLINWKMEPLSMAKEITNTRLMGLTLVVLGIAAFLYIWLIQ